MARKKQTARRTSTAPRRSTLGDRTSGKSQSGKPGAAVRDAVAAGVAAEEPPAAPAVAAVDPAEPPAAAEEPSRGKPTYSGGKRVPRYITTQGHVGDRDTAEFRGPGVNGSTFKTFLIRVYKWGTHTLPNHGNLAQPLEDGSPRPSELIEVDANQNLTVVDV